MPSEIYYLAEPLEVPVLTPSFPQRYSVFLVAMLSTLRAIALQSPFRRISRGVVCGVLVTYAIFLLAQVGEDILLSL